MIKGICNCAGGLSLYFRGQIVTSLVVYWVLHNIDNLFAIIGTLVTVYGSIVKMHVASPISYILDRLG